MKKFLLAIAMLLLPALCYAQSSVQWQNVNQTITNIQSQLNQLQQTTHDARSILGIPVNGNFSSALPSLCFVVANNDFEPCPASGITNGFSGLSLLDLRISGLTAHNVMVAQGSNPISAVAPGVAGTALVSQGLTADPQFTFIGVPGGGSGAGSFTAHSLLLGEGTNPFGSLVLGPGQIPNGANGTDPIATSQPSIGVNGGTGGKLTLLGAQTGSVSITVPDIAGSAPPIVLPATVGAANQCFQNDGTNHTFWGGCTAGGTLSTLNNAAYVQWKDNPGGTARNGIGLDASNILQLGGTGVSSINLNDNTTWAPGVTFAEQGNAAGIITFQTQNSSGTYNWNWPTNAGTAGQVLLSGGGANSPETWGPVPVSAAGLGITNPTQNGFLVGQGTNPVSALVCNQGTTIQGNAGAPGCVFGLSLGANASTGGSLHLFSSTAGDTTIDLAANTTAAVKFRLPGSNGTSGYVLSTDGTGVTSWIAPGNFTGVLNGDNHYSSVGGHSPTVGSGCGSGPAAIMSATATDDSFTITMGGGTITSCAVNFANFNGIPTNNPVCTWNIQNAFNTVALVPSPTQLLINAQSNESGWKIDIDCKFKG